MKKLIIIPAYNEAENIVKTVTQIVEKAPDFDYVIINDCSVDNTLQICKENNFNVISQCNVFARFQAQFQHKNLHVYSPSSRGCNSHYKNVAFLFTHNISDDCYVT